MLSPDFVRPTSSVLTALRTAKHKRPIVPIRKLSPSISIKTVIHAPGFYDFAQQNLFHARSRATAEISDKRALSTDCSHAAGMTVAHTPCALFPPNLAFGKEGGQACRSRPRKIPRKSRGVYLTFTPLPAPRRRGLVRRADERGVSPPVSPEPEGYPGGTASPLEVRDTGVSSRSSRSRPVPASECPSE